MMKKLISAVVAGIMLTFNCVGVYAVDDETSISINTAKYDNETKLVNVTGNVKNPVDSQIITIMSTGITQSSSFDFDTIVFIDQNEGVSFDENGNFSLSFALSSTAVEGKNYFVRVGGSEISSPAYMAFNFNANGEVTILYGDVTNDGKVDADDAAVLLKYVLDPSSVEISTEGLANAQIKATTIDNFTAEEVAMILEKAVDSGFLFPAELNERR